jgi:hypothetical protein
MARAMTRRLSQFGTLSLSGVIGVLAGCACCGPADSVSEDAGLIAEGVTTSSSGSAAPVASRLVLGDVSGEPALRDALMQVAESFADIHRRYQGLNTYSTHGTQGAFKVTLDHLRKEVLASYNPDQDKDLQKLIERLLDRNSSSGQRFSSNAAAEWQRAPKTDIQDEELKLLDRLDKQLEIFRGKVAAAQQNPSFSGAALTTPDLWAIVQIWRSYIAASGTPGFDPAAKFRKADPPLP